MPSDDWDFVQDESYRRVSLGSIWGLNMYPFIRLIKVLAKGWLGKRLEPDQTSVLHFRVWPNDLDTNIHMNNGRYLTMMDLGRFDLTIRMGLGKLVFRNKWMPVLSSSNIRYRRSLLPFAKYELHSRLLGWDDKWFYMEQKFIHKGDVYAIALAKGAFKLGRHTVPIREITEGLGVGFDLLALPDYIDHWNALENGVRHDMKSAIAAE
ncbi:thioesterase family protein [Aestuariispira insulae]|uniref:Acyl-CoA thioesterase FadM n=1 Tax=Aestuariispira insulae TaxID=1461337 RepID=A0A3D9H5B8_9PROT|nr:thioesterase family protein [Aestuariispira insulae]RED44670.1 acyl-CoA thioesterase FadM [Aestuariispira insulae]